jgi:chromosome segregation ATPase
MGFPKLAVALAVTPAWGSVQSGSSTVSVNPIRKVVTMLQKMQKTVEVEAEKEKELFDKFMCYCKNGAADLSKSIAEAETKVGSLPSEVEEAEASLAQLKEDLKKHQVDRSSAKAAMAEASAIREKEAAEYAKVSTELKTNIAALTKATAAIDKGMTGGFLQTEAAQVLKQLAMSNNGLVDADRQDLAAWLSGTSEDGYAPSSQSIVGILKQMSDTMTATLNEATEGENSAKTTYDELMNAKTKEVNALTEAIEKKTVRVGELGIEIVQLKEDLSDTEESLLEDKKFLGELDTSCATKQKEWQIIVKNRNEEILALSETIKILNDDDALEIFKKTLPGGSALLQVESVTKSARDKALALLQQARNVPGGDRSKVDFIMLAIRGKPAAFDKVIKMIDDMVALLKEEQMDDEHKKEYCAMQFDFADDKKKELERSISDLETAIEEAKEGLATCKTDIENLEAGIKALDKQVAEATEQRKEENSDYQTLMASDAQAKELLDFAKNRLNKFYNPKLYKEPAAASFVQIASHNDKKADPGPPPEAPGAYKKKSGEGNNVIAMIDVLVKELDTEMTEAQTEERLAQEEYTELMATSSEKKRTDIKTLAEKEALKASLESAIAKKDEEKKDTTKELMATEEYISSLHAECDWLLKYFDMRKEARTGEIDSLNKAKAVLSGADFSLLQTKDSKFLGRA